MTTSTMVPLFTQVAQGCLPPCPLSDHRRASTGRRRVLGVRRDGSASRIRNCTFEANSVTATGGGVGLTDASPIIENCTFRGNEAAENGGGLASLNAQPLLSENLFCGNSLSQLSGNWQNGGGNVILNSCPTSCPADLDGSGVVGGADLGLLLAAFGSDDPMADLDGNGLVDGGDLGLLLVAWGTTCP